MEVKINGWPISTRFHEIDAVHALPHKGIDYAIPQGTTVPAISDGIVTNITHEGDKSFGDAVWVQSPDGKQVIYGHLSAEKVHVGQLVHRGDVIALSGNTGRSTGPHLHVQVMQGGKAIDPTPIVNGTAHKDIPWWDFKDQIIEGFKGVASWIGHGIETFFCDSLEIVLPTLAVAGILWWMCSFLPWANKAPKLVGGSLIAFMFYNLIKGAYA